MYWLFCQLCNKQMHMARGRVSKTAEKWPTLNGPGLICWPNKWTLVQLKMWGPNATPHNPSSIVFFSCAAFLSFSHGVTGWHDGYIMVCWATVHSACVSCCHHLSVGRNWSLSLGRKTCQLQATGSKSIRERCPEGRLGKVLLLACVYCWFVLLCQCQLFLSFCVCCLQIATLQTALFGFSKQWKLPLQYVEWR